jgi:hypothetical protein
MGLHRLLCVVLGLIATSLCLAAIPSPPAAPIEPVVDDYFDTKITDNYRWMEDRSAARFMSWIRSQRHQEYADQLAFFYWQIGRSGYQEK